MKEKKMGQSKRNIRNGPSLTHRKNCCAYLEQMLTPQKIGLRGLQYFWPNNLNSICQRHFFVFVVAVVVVVVAVIVSHDDTYFSPFQSIDDIVRFYFQIDYFIICIWTNAYTFLLCFNKNVGQVSRIGDTIWFICFMCMVDTNWIGNKSRYYELR